MLSPLYVNTANFYFKMEDVAGTVVKDSSGKGANGYTTGLPGLVEGQYGKAISVVDGNDRVKKDKAVVSNQNITIMGWYKIDPASRGSAVYQNYVSGLTSGSAYGMGLGISTDGYYSMNYYGGSSHINVKTNVPAVDEWVHLAFTKSGSSYRMFINGELKLTMGAGHNIGTTFSTSYENGSDFGVVNFLIDQVILWERTLTDEEVNDVFLNYIITHKHLIKIGGELKSLVNDQWLTLGTEPVTKEMLDALKANDSRVFIRKERDMRTVPMDGMEDTEPVKRFKCSIDLVDIHQLKRLRVESN